MATKPSPDAVQRRNHAISLILAWTQANRPDIFRMAYDEAAKKYPYKKRPHPKRVELPVSMRNTK